MRRLPVPVVQSDDGTAEGMMDEASVFLFELRLSSESGVRFPVESGSSGS